MTELARCVGQEVLGDELGSTVTGATAYAPSSASIEQVVRVPPPASGNDYLVIVRGDIRSPYSGTASTGSGEQTLPSGYPAMWLAIPESSFATGLADAVCASEPVASGYLERVPDLSPLGPGVPIPLAAIPSPPSP